MKKTISILTILLSTLLSGLATTARGEESSRKWHYFAGFNVSAVPALHQKDSRIAVQVPIGAFCGAVKDFGVYMRMSMSPTINTHTIYDSLDELKGYIGSPVLSDGKIAMKAVYNQVAVGPMFRVYDELYVYCGLAWYQMRAFVKNTNDEYVRVKDRCTRTIGVDAGAMYRYRHVFASAGASLDFADWIDSSPYHPFIPVNLSFGYFF